MLLVHATDFAGNLANTLAQLSQVEANVLHLTPAACCCSYTCHALLCNWPSRHSNLCVETNTTVVDACTHLTLRRDVA